jgi:hypothetical protein
MMTTIVSSLPQMVRDLPSVEESPHPVAATAAETVVCRTVVVRADRERLQTELERELRALLGFGRRFDR